MKPFYRLAHILSNIIAKLYFRRRVIHPEKLRVPGGCLVVANHASFLDPPMIGSAFPDVMYYMGRKTLFTNPLASWVFRATNAISVDQERPELGAIKHILRLVKEGNKVLIFPEGERTWDGELKARGALGIGMLIAKSRKPVIPVRLFGAFEALPRGAKFPRPAKMTLVGGDVLELDDLLEDSGLKGKELYAALSDRAMEAIAALQLPESENQRPGGEGS